MIVEVRCNLINDRLFYLKIMELVKVATNAEGKQVVSARELHQYLEVGANVNDWVKRQAERAILVENEDFTRFPILGSSGQTSYDYALTLSSAKEISMLNGGEKVNWKQVLSNCL